MAEIMRSTDSFGPNSGAWFAMLKIKQFVVRTLSVIRRIVPLKVGITKLRHMKTEPNYFFSSEEECIPASSCQQYIEDNERLGSFDNQSDEFQEISSKLEAQICEKTPGREERVCCRNEVRYVFKKN